MRDYKTTTAAKMAIDLSLGLFSKFTEQIDPNELGENQRSIDIATKYFDRLNIKKLYNQDVISKLIYDYPSHSFVIDREEAQQIFKNVREPNEYEYILESYLKAVNQDYNVPQVYNINELVKEGSKNEQNITTDHEHQTVDGTGTESNLSTGKIISGKEGEAPTKSASKKVKLVPAS